MDDGTCSMERGRLKRDALEFHTVCTLYHDVCLSDHPSGTARWCKRRTRSITVEFVVNVVARSRVKTSRCLLVSHRRNKRNIFEQDPLTAATATHHIELLNFLVYFKKCIFQFLKSRRKEQETKRKGGTEKDRKEE